MWPLTDTCASRALPTSSPDRGPGVPSARRRNQSGFNLIELMTVVAIVGVLSALAMVSHHRSMMRARIAEGFTLIGPAKMTMLENLMTNLTGSACEGIADSVSPTGLVGLIRCVDDGSVAKIHVEMGPDAGDAVFELVSDRLSAPTWHCVADPVWPGYEYVPSICRN